MKINTVISIKLIIISLVTAFLLISPTPVKAQEVESSTSPTATKAQIQKIEKPKLESELTIEELRKKYPIEWYEKKFGPNNNGCEDSDSDVWPNGGSTKCDLTAYLNELNNKQVKSIFAHFSNLDARFIPVVEKVLKSLKEEQNSKYKSLKDFIYSKVILLNLEKPSCEIVKNIPETLPYYRELIMYYDSKKVISIFPCASRKIKDDFEVFYRAGGISVLDYASPRVQKLYQQTKTDPSLLKKLIPNLNNNQQ